MNILETITERTRERIREQEKLIPPAEMRRMAEAVLREEQTDAVPAFERALRQPGMSFICEVKKASPSKGIIAEEFPYMDIAKDYETAGASAISCLTEPYWFMGSDVYLEEIAEAVSSPVLRKDFTCSEYMIWQAKALGASAVLLICSVLDDSELRAYYRLTEELHMSALVEAHDADEIERAKAAGAREPCGAWKISRSLKIRTRKCGRARKCGLNAQFPPPFSASPKTRAAARHSVRNPLPARQAGASKKARSSPTPRLSHSNTLKIYFCAPPEREYFAGESGGVYPCVRPCVKTIFLGDEILL